ncbi:MAG TPA: aldolase [Candidatus Hydrogenedentes bacterium]|nr:aldolase [Candidatus Hydrogenedentota bacterium]
MTVQQLKQALRCGQRVYGTAITSTAPRWPEGVAGIGLDLVFIDTEHIPIDREQLGWMCQTYAALGLPPLVRIPKPDPYQASQVLDGGAAGVVVPYVESPHEVQALRGAVRFGPLKGERLRRVLDGEEELEPELAAYLEARNADRLVVVNIESVPAIEALDAILAVPDLDAVLIGPHDLSCSLGIPERYDAPRFLDAVRTIVRKARTKSIGAGIHFTGAHEAHIAWVREGMNLIIHGSDLAAFVKAMRTDVQAIRRAAGDDDSSGWGETVLV